MNDVPDCVASPAQWRCIGASVIGVRHKRDDKPCQDCFGYRLLNAPAREGAHQPLSTNALVVAVADGAGSAPLAQEGAHVMVESALAAVATRWERYRPASRKAWRDLVTQAFQIAQHQITKRAAAAGQPPRAYAATLLLAIISQETLVCGLVGDCAVVIATGAEEYQSLCEPQRGEYANTTYFATHHDLAQRLDIQLIERRVDQVALFSDGLLNLALNIAENQPYAPFFAPLFAFAREATDEAQAAQTLATFLDSERVNQRTHDDKTLVLVTRLGSDT